MQIYVNGEPKQIAEGLNLGALLADLDLKAQSRLQKARTNVDMAGESA